MSEDGKARQDRIDYAVDLAFAEMTAAFDGMLAALPEEADVEAAVNDLLWAIANHPPLHALREAMLARRALLELGVDLSTVKGDPAAGPEGP